jgi:hypothetical protein
MFPMSRKAKSVLGYKLSYSHPPPTAWEGERGGGEWRERERKERVQYLL